MNIGGFINNTKTVFRKNREIAWEKMSFEIKKITIEVKSGMFKKNLPCMSFKIENYYIYASYFVKLKQL